MRAGNSVLIGRAGITLPSDWIIGTVLWADHDGVLVEHAGLGGADRYREVFPVEDVRFSGEPAAVAAYKARCCAAVREAAQRVAECEVQLRAARLALYAELDGS
jgi:hypothetical protein